MKLEAVGQEPGTPAPGLSDGTGPSDGASDTADTPGTPDAHPVGLLTVGVIGSCMTRDNFNRRFNPDYGAWYRVSTDTNQPSFISLMAAPTPIGEADVAALGPGNSRRMLDDFGKRVPPRIAASPPDYLLVDFSGDIRYGAIGLDGDRWITNYHHVLGNVPAYAAQAATRTPRKLRLERDTDEYVARWTEAVERFARLVREAAPETTVILHRGHHTRRLLLPGSGRPVPLGRHRSVTRIDPGRMDELWTRLDDHAAALQGWRTIDLRGREYPTSDAHPWGAGYLHYSPDYYRDFLAALNAVHLAATADDAPGREAMAALVASRADDPGRGRTWDEEPGRGERPARVRSRNPAAGVLGRAHRLRHRLRRAVGRRGAPKPDANA